MLQMPCAGPPARSCVAQASEAGEEMLTLLAKGWPDFHTTTPPSTPEVTVDGVCKHPEREKRQRSGLLPLQLALSRREAPPLERCVLSMTGVNESRSAAILLLGAG